MSQKQILLNAFSMNCVGHINHGLWAHPRDRSSDFNKLRHWTDLARLLEKGLFDGLFLADILGVYDVYQNGIELTAKEAIQLPVNDPLMLVSAMAGATEHLGFGVTANLTYEAPYPFARRLSTLDHLSDGRVGWNIVTGYLESTARAMGQERQIDHDRRYDRADEYLEVLYKLWEGSWEDDAVIADRQRRIYAQPAKVHKVRHHGEFFDVEGYHLSQPSPQRTPLLFQAGASDRGLAFAARHAECVFVSAQTREATRVLVDRIRQAAVEAGRRADDIKVFMGINVIVAPTEAEARDKLAEYRRFASAEAGLAHFASTTGIDFSRYALDEPIRYEKTNAIESATKALTVVRTDATVRQLLEQLALGGRYTTLVGNPLQVADELLGWINEAGLDGFNLTRTVEPESYADFIDLVVPELQNRGAYKSAYADGTLREKLFGANRARLPARHVGASFRQATATGATPALTV
ncbi:LLM class flavin-dependent oxidoreductase [Pseudomonas sp. PDM23]|uniref:LLM class flavin-dependent oxidoreductase n=1 Tax=unclassified Pseudomonas TaxID=196821 RepID=UPI00178271CC|nr:MULTISPECIES: LLM class flavin-dependent oxidoreductase [unclassified Pseudomonas]MBD9578126.1 LLM class flavin-dependent oxidoreductase [Pseudomonas sp. PDM23]MBD9673325.1 LLM class flavin-dependent oxidoreductase [Pseudomonas sp. PDM21]